MLMLFLCYFIKYRFDYYMIIRLLQLNPLTAADILARAQIQTWKIPFKTKY